MRGSRFFQIILKGGGNLLGSALTINCLYHACYANATFNKHWLIKISMKYVYIKPDVKKRYNGNDCRYK